MRKEKVQARVHAVLETDWRTMAAELLERHTDGDETAPVSPSSQTCKYSVALTHKPFSPTCCRVLPYDYFESVLDTYPVSFL